MSKNSVHTKVYDKNDKLANSNITALGKDNQNNILIGTKSLNLYFLKDGKVNSIPLDSENFIRGYIRNISFSPSHGLFINSNSNIVQYLLPNYDLNYVKEGDWKSIVNHNYNLEDSEYAGISLLLRPKEIYYTKNNLLFTGTKGVSMVHDSSNNINSYIASDKFLRFYSSDFETNDSIVWLASKNGLESIPENAKSKLLQKYSSIIQYPLNKIRIDDLKRKWIGTDGFGLYIIINQDSIVSIEETKGTIISDIYIDEHSDFVFIASNKGVFVINMKNDLSYNCFVLKTPNGLPTNEAISLITDENNLYVGTSNGLAVLKKEFISLKKKSKPKLLLSKIERNGEVVDDYNSIKLNYKDNLNVKYVGIDFESNNNIHYEYKLNSNESKWNSTRARELSFFSLQKGNYKLHLKAIDAFGNNSETKTVFIKVLPAWWNTWWFRVLIAAILLSTIFLRYRYVTARKERELVYKQQLASMELQALQSQMNPHFIFNIMNSLQRLVIEEDFLKVNSYITSFSRLMRKFLDASREKSISLENELELLAEYLKLEKLRFKDKFDYKIYPPKDKVNLDFRLPTMIVQPFVENSIVHGINYKDGNGLIELYFDVSDNILKIEVTDDGVGIEKAKQMVEQSAHRHKSRGMEILNERIDVLKKNVLYDIDIRIIDKTVGENVIGTKIEISITKL